MMDFVLRHPEYLFLLFAFFFIVVKVIVNAIYEQPEKDNPGDDGGVPVDDPTLDLPPGVTLPKQDKEILV